MNRSWWLNPRPYSFFSILPGFLISLAITGTPASGQAVTGIARDTTTGNVITGVNIMLIGEGEDTVAVTETNFNGTFFIHPVPRTLLIVRARRVGFRPLVMPVPIGREGDTLHLNLDMSPLPTTLAPIVADEESDTRYAEVRFLEQRGFYNRTRSVRGHFINPSQIDRHRRFASRVIDYVRVSVPWAAMNGKSLQLRCGRAWIFVDDVRVLGDPYPDEAVMAHDVLAIEIFDGVMVPPPQYGSCAIVIWTRPKAARSRPR